MAYNLIDERWIPVERRSGRPDWIAPAQVVERDDPPVRIASPRPDFDGALLEFVIGLLQTAAAPASESAWEREFEAPAAAATLKQRFDQVRGSFDLDGDGPRFMQDLTVARDPKAKEEPIGALLIDRIGESGLKEGPSLFAKPGRFEALGYPAVAAALMAMQTYAPTGGRGQLTSVRGGGPLSTLVSGSDLWETAWLNVLPRGEFERRVPGDPTRTAPGAILPWLAPTRVSGGAKAVRTPPSAVHPLQHLWGLPRRYRLVIDPGLRGVCAVTGAASVPVVRAFLSRPDGTSYDGDYRHPWTPYTEIKPGHPWNPKKPKADGLPYRDWPLVVTGSGKRQPAAVVSYFASSRRRERVDQPRLTVFGYAMSSMTPLRWCRAETPLVTVEHGLESAFAAETEALVSASEEVRSTLSGQLRDAWSERSGGLGVFDRVDSTFWSATESSFFDAVRAVKSSLEEDAPARRDEAKEAWLAALHEAALKQYDSLVRPSADLAPPDLRQVVVARRNLDVFTRPSSPRLRKLLDLAVEAASRQGKGAGARRTRKESTP